MRDSLYEVTLFCHGSFVISMPLFGFLSCVVISLIWHFEAVTRTHCQVPNYLPSISAAIGDHAPQKYIWRIAIALHALPRMRLALIYYQYYKKNPIVVRSFWLTWWNRINSSLHIVENFALLVITYVSSTENFDVHEGAFVVFTVASILYMLSTCGLFQWTASKPMTHEEAVSLRWKRIFFLVNVSSFFSSVYFYFRHNWYCEPYIYTLFALCEYLVVLTNMGFHCTGFHDLKGTVMILTHKSGYSNNSGYKRSAMRREEGKVE